jgi:urea transport system substrate-binding protein
VGEEYYPLGHTQFNSVINKIKLKKPDVIYAIVVGGSNVAFYKQLKAAGIDMTKEEPLLLTISVTEDEILGIGGENIDGAYACMKYFQSLDNPNNQEFVSAFKEMWGDDSVIGDVTQAAYLGPWLWKLAVEKAGSFDIDKIQEASPGIEFDKAPEGYVRIHENHHLWSKTRVGRAKTDGQYEVVYETAELVEPDPFPEGYPIRSAGFVPGSSRARRKAMRRALPANPRTRFSGDAPFRSSIMFADYSWSNSGRYSQCRALPG